MKLDVRLRGLGIIIFVWVVLPFTAIILNNYFGLPILHTLTLEYVGWITFGLGLGMALYLINEHFRIGRNTPIGIEEPKNLMTKGLYKYSRNPMYLAILLMFLGRFFIRGDLLLLALFVLSIPAFHIHIVLREEPELKKKFGKKYLDYCKKVPRWLIR